MKVFLNQTNIEPTDIENKDSNNSSIINEILLKQKKK
jgi:hypothetical protein